MKIWRPEGLCLGVVASTALGMDVRRIPATDPENPIVQAYHACVPVFWNPQVSTDSFDLLLTDLGMPEMSGWDIAQAAKTRLPSLPVILVTGWGDQIDPSQLAETGVDVVLAKPYTLSDLFTGLSQAWEAIRTGSFSTPFFDTGQHPIGASTGYRRAYRIASVGQSRTATG